MANYLTDMGHRWFAVISGHTAHNDRARERTLGFGETLQARDIPVDPARILEQPYTFDAGREALRTLVRLDPPPTAVMCGNEVLAIGAVAEARALGIPVPQALSVTGFDDLEISSLIDPPLTTVRVPTREMGQLAAEHLAVHLADGAPVPSRELTVDLIVRGSSGPPVP